MNDYKANPENSTEVRESRWGTYDESGEFTPDNEYLFSLKELTQLALLKKQDNLQAGHYNKGDFQLYGASKKNRSKAFSQKLSKLSRTEELQKNNKAKKRSIRIAAANKLRAAMKKEDES